MAGGKVGRKGGKKNRKFGRAKRNGPDQKTVTEKNKEKRKKRNARWLASRQKRAKATKGRSLGESHVRNASLREEALAAGITIKELKAKREARQRGTHQSAERGESGGRAITACEAESQAPAQAGAGETGAPTSAGQ